MAWAGCLSASDCCAISLCTKVHGGEAGQALFPPVTVGFATIAYGAGLLGEAMAAIAAGRQVAGGLHRAARDAGISDVLAGFGTEDLVES